MATSVSADVPTEVPLAADEAAFSELESRIVAVAEALRATRAERDQAGAELTSLRAAHEKLQQAHTTAERELVSLRKERNEIRQRVGKLVAQLEASLA